MSVSVTPRHLLSLIALILLTGLWNFTLSQCDPPDLLPDPDCEEAPLICMTGACYSTQNEVPPSDPVNGWCGPMTALHNPQYIQFQVTALPVVIEITVNSCAGGGCGLQSAILNVSPGNQCDGWGVDDVVACDPGTNVGGTMTLIAGDPLMVDSFYLLVIDGCAGQICEWTIVTADNVFEPDLPTDQELTYAQADDPQACPGQDSWTAFTGDQIPGAAGYYWSGFPWGDETTTLPNLDISIPDDATPGVYEICVFAYTGCDSTDQICFDMEILPIPQGESPPDTLCPEEYDAGVQWGTLTITGEGEYTQSFEDPLGCISDSTKEFFAFPEPDMGMIDTLICGAPPFIYEGVQYDQAGIYPLDYPGGSVFGCDSMAELDLAFAYIEGDIVLDCDFGDWILSVELFNGQPQNLDPLYYWTNSSGEFISDEAEVIVTDPGTYYCDLIMEINGLQCIFPATPFTIVVDEILPEAPNFLQFETSACATQVAQYIVENAGADILEYIWEVSPCGNILTGQGNTVAEVDWQGCSGGMVCVSLLNHCGEGPQTCFDVEVIAEPIPAFDAPVTACVDEAIIVTFTGTASDNAQFFWNFGNANIISGGTGEGPHELSYGSTGTKVIALALYEPGCDTVYATHEIIVESLGTPVVSCESTTTSITFTWNQVPGASGYSVNDISGPPGAMINDTTYELTGLSNGQSVTIEVVVEGNGTCPDQIVEATCSAQDCTAPAHSVNAISPVCENDSSQIIELIVEGAPATGIWSGPGIVDVNTGEFSPMTAGAGSHQVSVRYDDGSCQFNWPVTIVVIQQPTANFTVVNPICEESTSTITYTGSADPAANYMWDFNGGVVVSGSGPGPYEIMWNSGGTYTVNLTVEENGCTSEPFSRQVNVDPAIPAPSIQCNTTTSSITFTWNNVPNATDYDVNLLDGPAGVESPNMYSVTGLTPGDSVTIAVVASGAGECPSSADTLTCYAQDCPSPEITVTPSDTALCLYPGTGTFNIRVDITGGGGSGSWSGNGIVDANAGTFDPNSAGAGTHMLTYTYTDQGCMFTREASVTVSDPPTADIASGDYTITCEAGSVVLDGSASVASGGTPQYLWTTSTGVIASRNDSSHAVVTAQGTYQLLITDPVSGCRDSASVVVTQDAGLPTADAGENQILNCEVVEVMLGGMSSSGPGIIYGWSTEGGNIISDPSQPTIMVDQPGTYELVVTDTNNGCESRDEADVSLNDQVPTIMGTADGILTCEVQTVTISSQVSNGSGDYSYLWSTSNGTIQSDPMASSIMVISPGIYQLVVEDNLSKCKDSIEVEVLADDDVITSLDINSTPPRCTGDGSGVISIDQVNGGSAPFTYAWSIPGETGTSISNLDGGTYAVTVTDANGCSFQQSVTIDEPQLVTADLGDNIEVNLGDSVIVLLDTSLDPSDVDSTIWGGLAMPCSPCFSTTFIGEISGIVSVTVVDTNGCTASAQISVNVDQPRGIFAPNVFTPNDDGVNDYFTIYGPSVGIVSDLTIYDRWGNLLYSQSEMAPGTPGWDGTMNGEELQAGVYVYYAKITHMDGFEEEKIGDVTLIR